LHSLPIQLVDKKGKRWSKALTLLSNLLLKYVRKQKPKAATNEIAENVLELLKEGLENPEGIERRVKDFLRESGYSGTEIIEDYELKEIKKRISIGLQIEERKQLNILAKKISGLSRSLKSKQYLQAMSGSTVKAISGSEKMRCFHKYTITKHSDSWVIKVKRYQWDYSSKAFDIQNPFETDHVIKKRIV